MQVKAIQPVAVFQALGDETRLRVVRLMVVAGDESCLCELVDSLMEPSYKLSRHLKVLRQAGVLASRKEGRWVYHRLVAESPCLELLYEMVRALPDSHGVYGTDLKRFRERLRLREGGRCQVGVQSEALKDEVV